MIQNIQPTIKIAYLITFSLLSPCQLYAEIPVISIDGPVFSTNSYLSEIGIKELVVQPTDFKVNPTAADVSSLLQFPIRTNHLTAGEVKAQLINHPELTQPFFIVGSDTHSKIWLGQYAPRLLALHAVGFLVQADSKEDWQTMQQIARELPLIPTSGDIFAERFGIQHYPILVSNKVVEQ